MSIALTDTERAAGLKRMKAVASERERIRQLRLHALERVSEAMTEQGQFARAAEAEGRDGEARRALDLVVAVDPDFRDASARAATLSDARFDNH